MKSQKEITLANDLQLRDRQDIYRNFLLYCMSGDVVALPMGSTVVVERDESEFARLSQLGEVLGLSNFDVSHVHKELAETAFRNQVCLVVCAPLCDCVGDPCTGLCYDCGWELVNFCFSKQVGFSSFF